MDSALSRQALAGGKDVGRAMKPMARAFMSPHGSGDKGGRKEHPDASGLGPDIVFKDRQSKGFGPSSLENQAGYDDAGLPCAILFSPA